MSSVSETESNHQKDEKKVISNKPHAVCLPFPAQGHINPMIKLAKLLHSKGFHITFVNTEYNHRRLLKSRGPDSLNGVPGFRFETITDGLPPAAAEDTTQDLPSLCDSTTKNCLAPFLALLRKLNSLDGSPPVSCVVSDTAMWFAIKAAREVGVPIFCLRTTNASCFFAYRNFPALIQKEILPLKDSTFLTNGYLESTLDWIPSLKNVRLRDLPTYTRTNDSNEMLDFIMTQVLEASKADALIFNTFDELERDVLADLSRTCPPIYTIGPLHSIINQLPQNSLKSIGGSLWKEDLESLKWLNSRAPNSVVYVNFGSITVLTPEQLVEFAWGLADSKKDFLWTLRPDAVKGDCNVNLPFEFYEETKERGLIVTWCPQEQVLNHPSIGTFLTHCGWNSMMESLASGVPMICWPFFADQHINCRFACAEWGVGLEIDSNVNRVDVANAVTELIDGEKGKQLKSDALIWKNKAADATTTSNGSSYLNIDKLVAEMLSRH
ncbi:OLC1v1002661C1 [Oldenlandia corymbosa var. corymbosa]|uniref:7-deoxyloganetin glucosyltransferase n=1 Tax=Oldenlandia corymbosa var. corymbosa TaxID=529605 RepID=A0AAV1DB12_OLDCO|nr:OLC1v1002661C1 [Oldenlandia corymbosa var. corymbosa]